MNDPKEIGERIRRIRKRAKITMKALGEKVGLSESMIWHYEKGDIKAIDLNVITKIANALEVQPETILDLNKTKDYGHPTSNQWGDDESNIEYLKKDPELLDQYLEITRDPQTRVLFDKVKDLEPEDVETILSVINSITRNK